MLSTSLSVDSSYFKLLEKKFRVLLRSIDKRMHKVLHSGVFAMDVAACQVADLQKATGLKIAKTTFPDERLDFNKTFQQIRLGLDGFYKERNPIFNNLAVYVGDEARLAPKEAEKKFCNTLSGHNKLLEIYHKEEGDSVLNANISPLWIAKTIMPEGRRDFNDTFFHIRNEIEKFYKEQNPLFSNTISAELWLNQEIFPERPENPVKESSCRNSVEKIHSKTCNSDISGASFSCAEGVGAASYNADSQLAGINDHQYSHMWKSDQGGFWEDVSIGGSAFLNDSLAAIENFPQSRVVTGPESSPVSTPLAVGSGERAGSTDFVLRPGKKRRFHRPVRFSWNFKGRKGRRQEKIPEAESGGYCVEGPDNSVIKGSIAHAG